MCSCPSPAIVASFVVLLFSSLMCWVVRGQIAALPPAVVGRYRVRSVGMCGCLEELCSFVLELLRKLCGSSHCKRELGVSDMGKLEIQISEMQATLEHHLEEAFRFLEQRLASLESKQDHTIYQNKLLLEAIASLDAKSQGQHHIPVGAVVHHIGTPPSSEPAIHTPATNRDQ